MNDDTCLDFSVTHMDKKSTSNDPRSSLYHADEQSQSFYYNYLNENKKSNDLENSSLFQSYAKEINKLKIRIEDLTKERNGLKQQCRAAITQWERMLRENNKTKDQLVQLQQQRDDALKKLDVKTSHEISQRVKTSKDLARLTEERNSAVQEYNLIMSERDSVHKEMEKLNEELGQYQKKIKSLEVEKKSHLESIEMLKNEIRTNQIKSMDKEFMIKQMYKEKYNDTHFSSINSFQLGLKSINSTNTANKWGSSSSGFSSGWTQYGNLSKNPMSSTNSNINSIQIFNSIDTKQKPFSISNSSSVSTMGNNKSKSELSDINELENRKQIQALEFECSKISFEFEQCLLQNEKIMQERESIKTLCDQLRRERDRAIRDRAEAIQDLNDFKLKIESNAQIKKYMDDLNDMNNLSDNKQQTNNACSKDSAISADIHEDYEHLNIYLVNNFRHHNVNFKNPWSFSIRSQDKNVIITGINSDSPAEDKLKLNDIILSINSINVIDEQLCNDLLNKFDKELHLVIQRKKQLSSILNINLDCCKNEHGIVLENAFLIKKLVHDSVAAKNGNISVGDRLLSINGNSLDNSTIHDVMQMMRENNLMLKVYKQSFNRDVSSVVLNQCDNQQNELQNSGSKFLNNTANSSKVYQKDDFHLTNLNNSNNSKQQQQSNYSPNIGHYQSIKRSSKKSKVLLNDSSSSFQIENDKCSPTLLDKAYNKLFKKSIKAKNEKKEERSKKSSPEKETLDDFNKILNNLSERDSKKKPSSTKSDRNENKNDKNGGTWPSCKSNTNLLSSPTYGKVNALSNTTYSKKKERKSLAIFSNYSGKHDSKEDQIDLEQENKSLMNYKTYNDPFAYGMIQSNKLISSRVSTPVMESSFKSVIHQQSNKHNERNSLSSSISSYSSKENYYKSNNNKKYTINPDTTGTVYKSFNTPTNPTLQIEQEYQIKKLKDKKPLSDYLKVNKQNKLTFDQTHYNSNLDQDEKSSKDAFNLNNPTIGFYSVSTNKRFVTGKNYTMDGDSYYSVEQDNNGDNENINQTNPYLTFENQINQNKKSSPISINQFKALDRSSITSSSPSYNLNEQLFSNSPSFFQYATFSNQKSNKELHKDNYYYSNNKHIYDLKSNLANNNNGSNYTSNTYAYISQPTSPLHLHQSSNPIESISSLTSNIYNQDDFLTKGNQRFYKSSNNSVASKLSNCSMDSNSLLHSSNPIQQSSGFFKKAIANESLDSASYSNIQNLRSNPIHVEWLKKQPIKNSPVDKKSSQTSQKRKQTDLLADKTNDDQKVTNQNKIKEQIELDIYSSSNDNQTTPGEIRAICIEKSSKEKSLGIQIECGSASKSSPGVFISCVNEGSLAKRVGLKVGDQLLEICGINMRSANKEAAASVLRKCGQTVYMKVKYNPDKFFMTNQQLNSQNNQSDYEQSTDQTKQVNKIERETNLDNNNLDHNLDHNSDHNLYHNLDHNSNHNLDQQENKDDELNKKELEDTLKDFKISTIKDNQKYSSETMDKEDSYSEKCLYF